MSTLQGGRRQRTARKCMTKLAGGDLLAGPPLKVALTSLEWRVAGRPACDPRCVPGVLRDQCGSIPVHDPPRQQHHLCPQATGSSTRGSTRPASPSRRACCARRAPVPCRSATGRHSSLYVDRKAQVGMQRWIYFAGDRLPALGRVIPV